MKEEEAETENTSQRMNFGLTTQFQLHGHEYHNIHIHFFLKKNWRKAQVYIGFKRNTATVNF